jgi:electron transfer flavoprotein alpha subunit
MKALVFIEHSGGEIVRGSLGLLSKAASLGAGPVGAVIAGGPEVVDLAPVVGRFGAATVHVAQDEVLDPPLPQPRVDVIEHLAQAFGYDTFLLSNSVLASDIAAGLAARLDAGLNWDLVDITVDGANLKGKRLAFQDGVLVEVGWRGDRRVGLFRPGSFDPEETGGSPAEVQKVSVEFQPHSVAARVAERRMQGRQEGPSVEDAEVVVAGGMGLGSAGNFALAEDLAGALGGVVGATRAAVYAGWYPREAQIGQTGKTVAPKLYLALGISGAIQHKVGMQSSKVIVSINKDPTAPIFECSDLAVVGDVHAIVPQLTALLRDRRGSCT